MFMNFIYIKKNILISFRFLKNLTFRELLHWNCTKLDQNTRVYSLRLQSLYRLKAFSKLTYTIPQKCQTISSEAPIRIQLNCASSPHQAGETNKAIIATNDGTDRPSTAARSERCDCCQNFETNPGPVLEALDRVANRAPAAIAANYDGNEGHDVYDDTRRHAISSSSIIAHAGPFTPPSLPHDHLNFPHIRQHAIGSMFITSKRYKCLPTLQPTYTHARCRSLKVDTLLVCNTGRLKVEVGLQLTFFVEKHFF